MFITDPLGKRHDIHNLDYADLLTLSTIVNSNLKLKGKPYPLLEDVLKFYTGHSKKKTILLEIKSNPALTSLPLSFSQLIKEIHTLLKTYHVSETCYIISFDYRLIEESKKQDKKYKVGLILHRNFVPLATTADMLDLSLLVLEKEWVTKEQVLAMQEKGIAIFTWTPNTSVEWTRLISLGVKGLITDKPIHLRDFKILDTYAS